MRLIPTLPLALLALLPVATASPWSALEGSSTSCGGWAAALGAAFGAPATGVSSARQEPAPAPKDDAPVKKPSVQDISSKSKADLLGEALLEAHGGAEALEKFTSLQFTVTPVELRPLPQAPGSDEPVQYEEVRKAPIHFQSSFSGADRSLRMDEDVEVNGREHTTTKIVTITEAVTEVYLLLDGQKRTVVAESRDSIIADITTLAGQFDILIGLGTRQLRGAYDGPARRGGVEYETVVAQFFGGINSDKLYRLYLNPTTHLVDRYDLYDANSQRLTSKLEISGYAPYEGLQLPSTLLFRNRQSEPLMRWEFSDYLVNAEIDPERFTVE
ncbi:hypothetical protein Pla163_08210 [Planctomycetes bacterium Pla163]|uniref:Uncharacterized protein n=1 Tax=Rohdeia mirabilis TaxID=2528008 RepID=A0A518CWY0_9BACT|nr:hypothetical protein Pla163_08210 [Planctomycetes bacterium Pla163]